MTTEDSETPPPTGRPRDPVLEQAILNATVEVVARSGFAAAKLEDIAKRAGTGKAAIYRRWPSKTALVVAAAENLQSPVAIPDTGSLREDLLGCVRHYITPSARAALALATVLAEASRNTELRDAAQAAIGQPPVEALRAVLARWIARGAVDPATPVDLIAGLVPAVAFHRVALLHQGLDEATAVALVDDVLLPALHAPAGDTP
ncbi:TetR/AcrR family transcriptional regulator [Catenuloplanes japonicus]|uniref:TetR/AcrR family transcriptional regulator n=1 Tax=Catenuloplanes japonicus TaxID=33876 RepID=UPI000525C0A2|nr:TetR/AcrR family transcriptional regulator [Catenuloplanes japonicus]